MLRFRLHHINYGKGLRIRGFIGLDTEPNCKIRIGNNFQISSGNMSNPMGRNVKSYISVREGASLTIGNNVGLSSATIWCSTNIVIGDNVKVGALSIIADTDAHSLDPVLRANSATDGINAKKRPVIIKDNAFIGAMCFIGKGVTIGENSIVGAGSVVTSSIPDNEIWAGNPARFIKKIQ